MARTRRNGVLAALGGWRRAFLVVAAGLVGVLLGLAVFTFGYANGAAYFVKDPASCKQCHAMNKQYDAWEKGSHHNVATCQDCHTPHDNIVKWLVDEADNGFWHSLKFTTGWYPDNIKAREVNREVTEEACRYCHKEFVSQVEMTRHAGEDSISCLQCHNEVGHKR